MPLEIKKIEKSCLKNSEVSGNIVRYNEGYNNTHNNLRFFDG